MHAHAGGVYKHFLHANVHTQRGIYKHTVCMCAQEEGVCKHVLTCMHAHAEGHVSLVFLCSRPVIFLQENVVSSFMMVRDKQSKNYKTTQVANSLQRQMADCNQRRRPFQHWVSEFCSCGDQGPSAIPDVPWDSI